MKAAFTARWWGWTPHTGTRADRPWVAEITGAHPTYRYARRFLAPHVDHRGSRDGVSNDVHCWWTLTSGCYYQARYLTGRRSGWTTRWLAATHDGDVRDTTEEEVARWVSGCSASTS